jgi:hypothetical protein
MNPQPQSNVEHRVPHREALLVSLTLDPRPSTSDLRSSNRRSRRFLWNSRYEVRHSIFDIRLLLLFASLGGGFAARLWAGEPSNVSAGLTVPGSAQVTSADAGSVAQPRNCALAGADLLRLRARQPAVFSTQHEPRRSHAETSCLGPAAL